MTPSPRSRLWWILITLTLLGLLLRGLHPGRKIHMGDEVISSLRLSGHRVADMLQNPACKGEPQTVAHLKTFLRPQSPPNPWPVLRSLGEVGAQHPPLYFMKLWGWASLFGSSIGSLRSLSVIFGVLCIPAMYLLGRDLFAQPLTAAIAATAIAVSPFHILYSQIARQSSLWILLTLISHWTLLRALRRDDGERRFWRLYTLSALLNLYTFSFSWLVVLGQLAFMRSLKPHMAPMDYRALAHQGRRTFTVLCLGYLPWAVVSLLSLRTLFSATKHLAETGGGTRLEVFLNWLQSLGRLWVDLRYPLSPYPQGDWGRWLPAIAIAAFSLYVFRWLMVHSGPAPNPGVTLDPRGHLRRNFLLSCLIFPGLLLIAADLILGGDRSAEVRYWAPSWLALELAVAHFLGIHITHGLRWQRTLWSAVTVGLLVASLSSSGPANAARLWWNNDASAALTHFPQEIQALNGTRAPHLLAAAGWNRLLLFSYYLRDDATLQWFCQGYQRGPSDDLAIQPGESWFVYRPHGALRERLLGLGYRLEPIAPSLPSLVRLVPGEPPTGSPRNDP